jgi:transmembrane sensor
VRTAIAPDLHDLAADWFLRARAADWTAADARRLEAWLAADADHRAAFDDVADAWTASGAAAGSPAVRAMRAEALAAGPRARRFAPAWAGLAAALLVVALLGAGVFLRLQSGEPASAPQYYRTEVGQRASVTLADGSRATLNTATELAVDYTPRRRGLRLVSGEAWFDVAKNPRRPFVVTAGPHAVTATGTSFDVRLERDRLRVAVSEGRVVVQGRDPASLVAVAAGQRAEVSGGSTTLTAGGPSAGDWRGGRLQFDAATLADAAAEMNRYRRTPLVLDDPGVGDLRISGVFDAGDNSGFLDALQATYPVRVERSAQAVHLAWRSRKK